MSAFVFSRAACCVSGLIDVRWDWLLLLLPCAASCMPRHGRPGPAMAPAPPPVGAVVGPPPSTGDDTSRSSSVVAATSRRASGLYAGEQQAPARQQQQQQAWSHRPSALITDEEAALNGRQSSVSASPSYGSRTESQPYVRLTDACCMHDWCFVVVSPPLCMPPSLE